ncbi:hypothetical protein CD33_17010 [Ureibacillus sinduriensis BLB-1 = JCM 15800]|uniref:Abortive phage infection protein n=2 Tax=Ureibacillus sinduriensis TaxID=561440 RepID=A0A0A3HTU7_9BACL|nr:hypothetical protein [Ureibacillus sinduriensis]KGR73718.1 hypothetical protein CD33_17010 [Ureibacillus sinduriensis BLB-1 = JCM 15800]
MEKYEKMIEQLKTGELENITITKEEFLQFRKLLVQDPMFKHFRGEAQQGGDVTFTFLKVPRS